jgi:outer membrane protein assembly factor BamB
MKSFTSALLLFLGPLPVNADWPTVRGNPARTGITQAELKPPFRLVWACHFENERLGSVVEPIVAGGRVFVGTHHGTLYALDAASGKPLWRFQAGGPILQAPAVDGDLVVVADAWSGLYVIEAATGVQRWALATGQSGGFAASPTLADGAVFIGMRQGRFLAYDLKTGRERWEIWLDLVPVRQTAAWHKGRVYFTAEDLKTRCVDARTGKVLGTSTPHSGQTARDGYPVLLADGNKMRVVVRTNPIVNMSRRITEDRRLLCKTAGVDDSHWQKLDAWTKSANAVGNPDLWEREQSAIVSFLHEHPEAQSFFVLDAESGKDLGPAPILWAAGCQGVGTAPVRLPGGKALVFYRNAYGNWNLGVAPLVALGELDLETNRITPWQHRNGRQPPWNTFWGTAEFCRGGGDTSHSPPEHSQRFRLENEKALSHLGRARQLGRLSQPPLDPQ